MPTTWMTADEALATIAIAMGQSHALAREHGLWFRPISPDAWLIADDDVSLAGFEIIVPHMEWRLAGLRHGSHQFQMVWYDAMARPVRILTDEIDPSPIRFFLDNQALFPVVEEPILWRGLLEESEDDEDEDDEDDDDDDDDEEDEDEEDDEEDA